MLARSSVTRPRAGELSWAAGFLAPALVGVGLFVIFPLFQAMFLATRGTDIRGNPTRDVGLENFARLFTPEFGRVLLHTLVFTAIVVVGGTLVPLALAIPMSQRLAGMRVFRTLFTLPFAYSASTASVVWLIMVNPAMSPINWALGLLGVPAPDWTTSAGWAMVTTAWITLWMASGFNLLVLSAALAAMDQEVIEASRLDGATGWRGLTRVVLPLISPSLFFVVVTTTLTALQALGQVQVTTNGGPNDATRTLVFSIYDLAFANGNSLYGPACAQGLVLLLVGILLAVLQFGVLERRVHYR
jgi:sn-glycerol 3-phosphate transport system permease protein